MRAHTRDRLRGDWTEEQDALIRAEYGSTPTENLAVKMQRTVAAVQSRASRLGVRVRPVGRQPVVTPKASPKGIARMVMREADHAGAFLRAEVPVYRCDAVGRQDAQGSFMRYGNAVLTQDELIAKAKRKGWNPDGWRQVA